MKKALSAVLTFVLILSLIPFQTYAQNDWPEWEDWEETHEIPYNQDQQIIYEYTATDFDSATQTIAFEYPREKGNLMVLSNMGEEGMVLSPPEIRLFNNETVVYVVTFTEGYSYTLHFENYSEDGASYIVKTYPWDDSMWPIVTAGDTKTVTIGPGNSSSYIVTVPKSGLYTLTTSRPELLADITTLPDMNASFHPKAYPNPASLGSFRDENGIYICCYYLEAGAQYGLEVFGGEEEYTGTFTLTEGAPNDDYAILQEGKPITLTIVPHDNENMKYKTLVFQAEHDGRYCLYSDMTHSGSLRDLFGQPVESVYYQDAYLNAGWVYTLKKGEYYIITVHNYTEKTVTDTVHMVHFDSYKNAEIKILGQWGNSLKVGLLADPPCVETEGVTWSVSDPSVLSITGTFGSFIELDILKEGTSEIIATVGSTTVKMTFDTTQKTPVMEEGKTSYLYKMGGVDEAATFTPAVSGTYKLHLTPHSPFVRAGSQKMFLHIVELAYGLLYENRDLTGTPVIELELVAGREYQLSVDSATDARFELVSATPAPTEPAPTEPAPTEPVPTEPAPTEPKPTDPAPTAPAPTEPIATEPTPTAPVATEPAPTDPKPTEPQATKPQPTEPQGTAPGTDVPIVGNTANLTDTILDQISNGDPKEDLVIDLTQLQKEDVHAVSISGAALEAAANHAQALALKLNDAISLHLDTDVLQSLAQQAGGGDILLQTQVSGLKDLNSAQQAALSNLPVHAVFHVDLTCGDTPIHQLNGKALITIPFTQEANTEWQVYYVDEGGAMEQMPIESIENGRLTIMTDHFSTFVLIGKEPVPDNAPSLVIPLIIAAVLIVGVVVFLILKKKKTAA